MIEEDFKWMEDKFIIQLWPFFVRKDLSVRAHVFLVLLGLMLYHLVQNAGWIVPHETLVSKVWGPEYRDEKRLLRLYITYLRKKIEPDPSNPRYIVTERGIGYRFVDFKGR